MIKKGIKKQKNAGIYKNGNLQEIKNQKFNKKEIKRYI